MRHALALPALLLLALHTAGSAAPTIAIGRESPALRFGAQELSEALAGAQITVGTEGDVVALVDPAALGGQAEAFAISREGDRIVVRGDETGAMFGLIDVAETVTLGGLKAVQPKRARPFLPMRGIKWNLPLGGDLYSGTSGGRPGEWLWDRSFWEQFLEMMARNRYNVLTLWNGCPYNHLVHLDDIPGASDLSYEQIEANIQFFRWAMRRARELGIQTQLITWNIHVPASFAKAQGIAAAAVDTPQVRAYLRRAVCALVDTYPDLAALGTCPGEQMPMLAREKQDWIADTYLAGLRQASRRVPFFLRYWQGDPVATADMLDREKWPQPVYLEVKFNGEHMYSSPRHHVQDQRWLDLADNRWQVFWHFRNDCLFRVKWGDPEFVREAVRNCAGSYACGLFWGSEGLKPGADSYHRPSSDAFGKYPWEFERKAEMYRLWGRLGYDPETRDDVLFLSYRRFGPAARDAVRALAQASRVVPLTTSFHWNYMNGDWQPEFNTGAWNTSYEMAIRSFRDQQKFHSVKEFIFNDTIEPALCNIPDFVALQATGQQLAAGRLSPRDAAQQILDAAEAGEAAITQARRKLPGPDPDFACLEGDVRLCAELGRYYGKKILAANALARALILGDEAARPEAVRLLEECASHWNKLVALGAEQYPTTGWREQIPEVQADIAYARTAQPLPKVVTTWQVAAVAPGMALPQDAARLAWRELRVESFVERGEGKGLGAWLNRLNSALGTADLRQATGMADTTVFAVRRSFAVAQAGVADIVVQTPYPASLWVNGKAKGSQKSAYLSVPVEEGTTELLAEVTVPREALAVPFDADLSVLPVTKVIARLECEQADVVQAPMVTLESSACSGGACVHVPEEAGRGDDAAGKPIDHGRMAFSFTTPDAGTYDVWVRVLWPATTANSYFLQVDDGEAVVLGQDEAFGRWHWVKAARAYPLTAGKHTLLLRTRETDTRADVVVIAPAK
ncbi:hypothetical protein LLH03_16970 [bacterium]|nr:hypothetical protein [bacterium]